MAGKLDRIKQAQIEAAKESGADHPYIVVDTAKPEAEKTVVRPVGTDFGRLEHYQAAMDADLNSLKDLKTLDEKQAAKKTMIETYWGFVKSYMDNGDAYTNRIAVQLMIWLFDTLDIERALNLAFHLIEQGIQQMPPRFERRDLPTFVCDASYDWANELLKKEQSASPYLDAVVAHIDNDKWSLSPPVQSKMYALLAKHKNREGDWLNCIALCEKAEAVNPEGAGVKTMKEKAQKNLKPTE
ncbi:phage terminase small subunit [Methylobacter sp. Wu8]|uniref:phage terminase small subunit n=1 Tax=Methylobacter sp. Wu8 TaxID=3118457 RepID=UPI002F2E6571